MFNNEKKVLRVTLFDLKLNFDRLQGHGFEVKTLIEVILRLDPISSQTSPHKMLHFQLRSEIEIILDTENRFFRQSSTSGNGFRTR